MIEVLSKHKQGQEERKDVGKLLDSIKTPRDAVIFALVVVFVVGCIWWWIR